MELEIKADPSPMSRRRRAAILVLFGVALGANFWGLLLTVLASMTVSAAFSMLAPNLFALLFPLLLWWKSEDRKLTRQDWRVLLPSLGASFFLPPVFIALVHRTDLAAWLTHNIARS